MNNPYDTLNEPAPVTSDKWPIMNILELQAQRSLLNDRYMGIMSMIDGNVSPSTMGMYVAIGNSLIHLDELIENRRITQHVKLTK